MKMIQQLRGSTALLTGASRGIGALMAERLAAEGMHLILTARDARRLEAVRRECQKHGAEVRVVPADVASPAGRERVAREAADADVLINNAGVEVTRALVDQTAEDVASQLATNLTAPIELIRLLLPGMLARRRGAIVNVSSMSGKVSTPYNAVYAATKFGLDGLTSSLRIELEGSGVHVGSVCPSFVADRGMWADTGCRPPALFREVRPEKVVDAVIAVLRGAREVLVTPGPVRPLLVLREAAPAAEARLLRAFGVLDTLKQRARRPHH